jgi:O-antigen/teichoic acid export membrane protein
MLALIKTSSAGLLLRLISMLGKFLIVVYIAKYFLTQDLGIFGLFNSTVILAMYLLGFEFYNFNTREILAARSEKISVLIRNQFIAFGFTYLLILPILIPMLYLQFLPRQYLIWFYAILITEHVSVEFYRIFTILARPIFANFIFFIKNGSWSLGLIALWLSGIDSTKTLQSVWLAWFGGSLLACLLSWFYLRHLKIRLFDRAAVDWTWIKKGFKISIPFFVVAISLRLIEQSGRFFLDLWTTKSLVGIYTFFWNIANMINVLIFTGIIMILFPKLIESYKKEQRFEFEENLRQFKKMICWSSFFLSGLLVLLIKPLLVILGKGEFSPYLDSYYILVLAFALLNLSYIPHYILYAKDADKVIMWCTLCAAIINITGNFLLIPGLGLSGAALSILLSYLVMGGGKYYFVQSIKSDHP